jgi:NADPH2:quinone reductase
VWLDGAPTQIAMGAIAVNFADHLMLRGQYQIRSPLPHTPGSDFAGTVTRVGSGVASLKVGDRVSGGTLSGKDHASGRGLGVGRGGFGEVAVLPEDHLRVCPPDISLAQASMLGTTYGTAHYALRYEARLQPGEVCLVHAAAGALGLAACQVTLRPFVLFSLLDSK